MEEEALILKEYGRNVQKLIKYINTLPTVEERTKMSHVLIQLMKQINPAVRENTDNNQRIWDHLYVMSGFTLDIEGPYPKPSPEMLESRPRKMEYRAADLKYKNYGRNIQNLIQRVIEVEEPEKYERSVFYLAQTMKSFYAFWNKDNITDEMIADHLYEMSKHKIDIRDQVRRGQLVLDVIQTKEPIMRDDDFGNREQPIAPSKHSRGHREHRQSNSSGGSSSSGGKGGFKKKSRRRR